MSESHVRTFFAFYKSLTTQTEKGKGIDEREKMVVEEKNEETKNVEKKRQTNTTLDNSHNDAILEDSSKEPNASKSLLKPKIEDIRPEAQSSLILSSSEKTQKSQCVCVSNLNPRTSEESLSNFLEGGLRDADVEIVNVVFSKERSIAIIQFSSPVDYTEIQNRCRKRTLVGKSLAVSLTYPLKYVVVSGDEDITEENLKSYFESPESHGGEVQKVSTCHDGSFEVKFKHEKDVLRVCSKSYHEISNSKLIVTPMFFTDGADVGIYDVSKHTIILPSSFIITNVDVYIRTFLQQSIPVLVQLNSRLKARFAKVTFSEETKVECLLSQKTPGVKEIVKVWETAAKEYLFKCINEMLLKLEIVVTKDAWNEVENCITQQELVTDTVLTIYEKSNLKIIFIGEKSSVQNVHKIKCKQYNEIEEQIQREKRIVTVEIKYSPPVIRLLQKSGIFEEINSQSDDLKVSFDSWNGKIQLTGVNKNILPAKLNIVEKINRYDNWKLSKDLSKSQLKILAGEPVQSMLESKFLENNFTVEMDFGDDSIMVYTTEESQRVKINRIIVTMTKESEIFLDATSIKILLTDEWELEVKAICEKNKDKVRINTVNDTKLIITSTNNLHDDNIRKIKKFLKEHSIHDDAVNVTDDGILKFILKHCSVKLKDILEKNKLHNLRLDLQQKQVVMSGSKKGLSTGKWDIWAMIQGIKSEERTYSQPGIHKILIKDNSTLDEIEGLCRTVILFMNPNQVVNQSVTVKIYGHQQQDIQNTEHEITRFIHSRCKKADITDNILNGLNPHEISEIHKVRNQHHITMSIHNQNITMEGVKEDVYRAKETIYELLRQFHRQTWMEEDAKILVPEAFPGTWVPMKDLEIVKVVPLDQSSAEYKTLEKKFLDSVKNGLYNTGKAPNMNHANNPVGQFNKVKVSKIERIQNPSLYRQYVAMKSRTEKHVDQNTAVEQDLWHGTNSAVINSINYYGFSRSYCGDNGGEPWYGRGVSFANDASYSARDWVSQPDTRNGNRKKMYLANVITGHYCRGNKNMRFLPERMSGVNYDCAVDDVKNPQDINIFNDTQAYPMYCIEFTI